MSGPPDHVTEQEDGSIEVGKSQREQRKEDANSNDQMDRIESKLDLILDELGVDL